MVYQQFCIIERVKYVKKWGVHLRSKIISQKFVYGSISYQISFVSRWNRLVYYLFTRIAFLMQFKRKRNKLGLRRTRYHTRWNKMRYIIMLWCCYTIKWTIFPSSSNLILSFISCAFLTFINLILPLLQISLDETHWSKKMLQTFFIWQDRFFYNEMKNERLDETVVQSYFFTNLSSKSLSLFFNKCVRASRHFSLLIFFSLVCFE